MLSSCQQSPKAGKSWIGTLAMRIVLAILGVALGASLAAAYTSEPVAVGRRDFNYGSVAVPTPTAEKPQSKLWFAHGSWWGCLWDPEHLAYRLFRCDLRTQSWESVGPTIETRPLTLQDCLYDGERVYVVSHVRSETNGPAWLSRFSWNPELRSWSLDAGFPTQVMDRQAETVVIDKDSRGRIWATWEYAQRIWVNRTVGDDRTWGVPFELPGQGADVTKDDICALGAFGGKIGLMWSNQNDRKFYFAVHQDGDPDDRWTREEALGGTGPESWADDHISLKIAQCDGCVFAVVKTDLTTAPTDPTVYLLRRDPAGSWSRSVVATSDDAWTRPTLVLDREQRRVHVFAQSDEGVVGGAIRVKSAAIANPVFAPGPGALFLHSETETAVNDPTSTKQTVDAACGVLVLASDAVATTYLHNWMEIERRSPAVGLAVAEKTVAGEVRGTYLDTHIADGVAEVLRERIGGVSSIASVLDHRWTFEVPAGRVTEFHVRARATVSADLDNFVFWWSRDGRSWRRLVTVIGGGDEGREYRAHLQEDVEGRVIVRVTDSNRLSGARTPDTIWVDHMFLTSGDGGVVQIARIELKPILLSGVRMLRPQVVVCDENRLPVANVSVTGAWTGVRAESETVRTDKEGVARFSPKAPLPGIVATFCVTNLTHPAFAWAADRGTACASWGGTAAQLEGQDAGASPDELRDGPVAGPTPSVTEYGVEGSFPNPFHHETEIRFQLPRSERVVVRIFNALGQEVRTLVDREYASGRHGVRWDGRDASGREVTAGAYFYRVEAGEFSRVQKTLLLR
jgi:hypothetical protein